MNVHTCTYMYSICTFGVAFLSERFIMDSWGEQRALNEMDDVIITSPLSTYHGLLFKGTCHPHFDGPRVFLVSVHLYCEMYLFYATLSSHNNYVCRLFDINMV